jgi:hypothetical protein
VIVTAFDVTNDHVLLGEANLTFTLENQGNSPIDTYEVQVVYSDDDIIGNGDDLMVGSHTMADTLINAATADTMTVQLPMDMLNSRAQADDAPGQGSGYVSSSVDYIALMMGDGDGISHGRYHLLPLGYRRQRPSYPQRCHLRN